MTLDERLNDIIHKHTSFMLDNPSELGIYKTTQFYNNLRVAIKQTFIEECVPEIKLEAEPIWLEYEAKGFNSCREEVLRRMG